MRRVHRREAGRDHRHDVRAVPLVHLRVPHREVLHPGQVRQVHRGHLRACKNDQAPVDPNDVGIVENDPYPPEDESYYYEIMQYCSILEYVDKNQPNYNDLYLPKESLVTYDIQVRIDHKPSA